MVALVLGTNPLDDLNLNGDINLGHVRLASPPKR